MTNGNNGDIVGKLSLSLQSSFSPDVPIETITIYARKAMNQSSIMYRPDGFLVEQRFSGLCSKFNIMNVGRKADALSLVLGKYLFPEAETMLNLGLPAYQDQDDGTEEKEPRQIRYASEIKLAVLTFLLECSEDPVRHGKVTENFSSLMATARDTFHQKQKLIVDEILLELKQESSQQHWSQPYDENDMEMEIEDEDEHEGLNNGNDEAHRNESNRNNDDRNNEDDKERNYNVKGGTFIHGKSSIDNLKSYQKEKLNEFWLRPLVHVDNPVSSSSSLSVNDSVNLIGNVRPILTSPVSVLEIIRDSVFMLSGIDSFMFPRTKDKGLFKINLDVSSLLLSSRLLKAALNKILDFGNTLVLIRQLTLASKEEVALKQLDLFREKTMTVFNHELDKFEKSQDQRIVSLLHLLKFIDIWYPKMSLIQGFYEMESVTSIIDKLYVGWVHSFAEESFPSELCECDERVFLDALLKETVRNVFNHGSLVERDSSNISNLPALPLFLKPHLSSICETGAKLRQLVSSRPDISFEATTVIFYETISARFPSLTTSQGSYLDFQSYLQGCFTGFKLNVTMQVRCAMQKFFEPLPPSRIGFFETIFTVFLHHDYDKDYDDVLCRYAELQKKVIENGNWLDWNESFRNLTLDSELFFPMYIMGETDKNHCILETEPNLVIPSQFTSQTPYSHYLNLEIGGGASSMSKLQAVFVQFFRVKRVIFSLTRRWHNLQSMAKRAKLEYIKDVVMKGKRSRALRAAPEDQEQSHDVPNISFDGEMIFRVYQGIRFSNLYLTFMQDRIGQLVRKNRDAKRFLDSSELFHSFVNEVHASVFLTKKGAPIHDAIWRVMKDAMSMKGLSISSSSSSSSTSNDIKFLINTLKSIPMTEAFGSDLQHLSLTPTTMIQQ